MSLGAVLQDAIPVLLSCLVLEGDALQVCIAKAKLELISTAVTDCVTTSVETLFLTIEYLTAIVFFSRAVNLVKSKVHLTLAIQFSQPIAILVAYYYYYLHVVQLFNLKCRIRIEAATAVCIWNELEFKESCSDTTFCLVLLDIFLLLNSVLNNYPIICADCFIFLHKLL